MKKLYFIMILLIALIASACGSTEPEAVAPATDIPETAVPATDVPETVVPATDIPETAVPATDEPEPALHEMNITATAEGWDAPASVPAGWTKVTLINESEGLRQAAFLRLDDDKSMDDVFAAIEAGMEGPPAWMTPYGGVSGVLPGENTTVSLNLAAGQYIVIDPVPGADGVPGMAKGYFMPLVVEESNVTTAAPAADLSVELVDYAFKVDFDTFTAGKHTIKVTNSGAQEAHELVIVKLDDGATIQDFLSAFAPDAPGGAPPGVFIAGTGAFDEVTDNYLEVEFEAGATYGIVCFTPSTENGGQPHFTLGMVGQFTVQE